MPCCIRRLGRFSLKLPLHKGMRCASAEGHRNLIFRLNRHIGRAAGSRAGDFMSGVGAANSLAMGGLYAGTVGAADPGSLEGAQVLRITRPVPFDQYHEYDPGPYVHGAARGHCGGRREALDLGRSQGRMAPPTPAGLGVGSGLARSWRYA